MLYSLIKKTFRDYFMIVNTSEGDVLTTIFSYVEKNQELLLLPDKNMLYIPLQCMNEYEPFLRSTLLSERNPFNHLFEGLDSEYIMGLNIGAIWNVISLWIHRGMQGSPNEVRDTIEQYLTRLKQPSSVTITTTVPKTEVVEQPKPPIPPRPIMPPEAAAFPRLQKVKVTLDKQNHLIFEAERERTKLEIELSDLKGLARLTKKKELESRISTQPSIPHSVP